MKIIKEGKIKKEENNKRLTCEFCDCIFEYNNNDLKTEKFSYREFDNSLYLIEYKVTMDIDYICCPTCGHRNSVKSYNIDREMVPFSSYFER